MDFTELYAQKKMTAAQAAALVKSGDWVDYGYFAEPDGNRAVLADLHAMTVRTKELYRGVPYFLLGPVRH